MTFITAGYTGQKPEYLAAAVERLDATVFDIRFSPLSRNPAWAGASLKKLLGSRYLHVRELGNKNYKGEHGDGVMILDYEAGKKYVRNIGWGRIAILLCACQHYEGCHRRTVAEMLIADRYKYLGELDWAHPVTLPLF